MKLNQKVSVTKSVKIKVYLIVRKLLFSTEPEFQNFLQNSLLALGRLKF